MWELKRKKGIRRVINSQMKSFDWEKRVERIDLHKAQREYRLRATVMTKWVVKMDVLLHDFSMKPQLNRKYFPFKCFGNFSVLRQLTTNPPPPPKRSTWVHGWRVISGSLYSLFPLLRERTLTAQTIISLEVPHVPEEETSPMSVMNSTHDSDSC